jgi:hypothetical protein
MKRIWLGVSILCLLSNGLYAAPVPIRDLVGLTKEAETIIVGRIVGSRDIGPSGSLEQARIVESDVEVDEVIKGSQLRTVKYRFSVATMGLESLDTILRQERVFFLKRAGDYFEAVNQYYPSVVGVRGVTRSATETLDRVVEVVGGVIQAPTPTATKMEAVYTLWGVNRPAAAQSLRRAAADSNVGVRLAAAAALLSIDDVGGWPTAEAVLLARSPAVPADSDLFHNLIVAIAEGVKSKQSIPFLTRLLRSDDARTRRAATSGLRHTRAEEAISPHYS